MSKAAELPTKDTIALIINRKNIDKVTYVFKNKYGNKIGEYENKSPATLSSRSNVARQFKQLINPKGDMEPAIFNNKFTELKQLLQLHYENEVSVIEQEIAEKKQVEQEQNIAKSKEAITKLQSLDYPLIYIGSLVEWFTAGERNNIMYAFTVYAGQVVLGNPVSVICLGEASSGKSHIQETTLMLIPQQYIVNEKKITEAALFNRAKTDEYFYDGKIVNYGDMGGSNDHEFMEESKNLMKELQSDGFLNKPLSIPQTRPVAAVCSACGHPHWKLDIQERKTGVSKLSAQLINKRRQKDFIALRSPGIFFTLVVEHTCQRIWYNAPQHCLA